MKKIIYFASLIFVIIIVPILTSCGSDDKDISCVSNNNTNDALELTYQIGTEEFNMVRVEGSSFTMGATDEQYHYADNNEYPTHKVALSDFYIGTCEVTQGLWNKIMDSNSNHFIGDKLPVDYAMWLDCILFCNKLSDYYGYSKCYLINGENVTLLNKGKGGFRLPTESEWEYAARGGCKSNNYLYSGGNNLSDYAWCISNSEDKSHAVGTKLPNEIGLYDMSGNVWEWCWDFYGIYPSYEQTNPLGPTTGFNHIRRGGAWDCGISYSRVSERGKDLTGPIIGRLGLRLVYVPF